VIDWVGLATEARGRIGQDSRGSEHQEPADPKAESALPLRLDAGGLWRPRIAMDAERWRKIEQLYRAALECRASERAGFLSRPCQ
jgi:hypothetical protein